MENHASPAREIILISVIILSQDMTVGSSSFLSPLHMFRPNKQKPHLAVVAIQATPFLNDSWVWDEETGKYEIMAKKGGMLVGCARNGFEPASIISVVTPPPSRKQISRFSKRLFDLWKCCELGCCSTPGVSNNKWPWSQAHLAYTETIGKKPEIRGLTLATVVMYKEGSGGYVYKEGIWNEGEGIPQIWGISGEEISIGCRMVDGTKYSGSTQISISTSQGKIVTDCGSSKLECWHDHILEQNITVECLWKRQGNGLKFKFRIQVQAEPTWLSFSLTETVEVSCIWKRPDENIIFRIKNGTRPVKPTTTTVKPTITTMTNTAEELFVKRKFSMFSRHVLHLQSNFYQRLWEALACQPLRKC
ncbi:uncharacterized protein LOC141937633 [Strix uralensis]|uniref:uncharacterized protein LOC141937633 n=1 Tax=Strix uralensis TaxID=36305 RepID=UPI003DA76302